MFRSAATRTTGRKHSNTPLLSLRKPQRQRCTARRLPSCVGSSSLRCFKKSQRWLSTAEASSSSKETTIESLEVQVHHVLGESLAGTDPSSPALKAWLQTLSVSQRSKLGDQLAAASSTLASEAAGEIPEPSMHQLRLVALNNAIPFLGFGFMDNAILIIAGDAIDTSLGVLLGISTMCAAAIGNIVSDVAGILLGTAIEDMAANLNLPTPNLSAAQRQLRSVRFANQFGCGVGIVIGCIIGMFPLLLIDSNKVQLRKRQAHLDSIFRDVVTEAGSLVGASHVSLFVRVEEPDETKKEIPIPTADGKFLYAKYGGGKDEKHIYSADRLLPLGRGIVSRAALTGDAWRVDNVQEEPDYHPSEYHRQVLSSEKEVARAMLCVPVLDPEGNTIAVLQAINKVGKGLGSKTADEDSIHGPWDKLKDESSLVFTNQDEQIFKALASHIGVSLQRLIDESDNAEDELRMRDTISMLKEYGLAGIGGDSSASAGSTPTRTNVKPRLFPE